VWLVIIAIESTDSFSAQNTGGMLYSLLIRWFGHIDLYRFLEVHHYLRKAGHVIGYGMLSLLLLRGLRATFHQTSAWAWRTALISLLGTVFVASMDEWHQSFIPSRMGSPRDVALDSVAGLIFLLMAYAWMTRTTAAEQTAEG
jgi:VanZ family protein